MCAPPATPGAREQSSGPTLLSDEETLGERLPAMPSTKGGDPMADLDVPRPPLATVLRSPALKQMLPSLTLFTARCLVSAGGAVGRAPDVLQDAFVQCLAGEHPWPEGMELRTFLQRVIKNRAFCAARTAARESKRVRAVEVLPDAAARQRSCDEQIDDRRLLEQVEAVAAADPETKSYVEVVADGNTDDRRADHAEAAQWSPDRVARVGLRLKRRLESAGLFPTKAGKR
jgi:DNA-directed RNA polymerase specialized sigma24 family protein